MNANTRAPASSERSTLRLEFWPLERLLPSPRNARTHSEAQVAEIAGSIRAFGFTNPILVGEDGDVIAGHGRLAAARLLALQEVPVIALRGLSEVQRRQLMLADNRIALNAGWDTDLLQLELRDLSELGADLSGLGFTAKELAAALRGAGAEGLTDENEVPALADAAVTRPGDVWLLGDHRIICGDCTKPEVVNALLRDAKPVLMVTDPPYGVNYDPTWRHRSGVNKSARVGKVANDERADWTPAWRLFPGSIAYVWHGALHAATVEKSLTDSGFSVRAQIIWAKERLVIGRGDYAATARTISSSSSTRTPPIPMPDIIRRPSYRASCDDLRLLSTARSSYAQRRSLDRCIDGRNHDQQGRGHNAADHQRRDTLHDFGAVLHMPS